MDKVNVIIAYFQNAIEECIDQTGEQPTPFDISEHIDSEEFRDLYRETLGRELLHGSEGVAQILIDVLEYYK